MTEIEPGKNGLKGSWSLIVIIILIILIVFLAAVVFLKRKSGQPPAPAETAQNTRNSVMNGLVPENTRNPEDFMVKVKEKSDEMKKNYDSNLVEFAHKRWKKFFLEQNSLSGDLSNDLKTESQEIAQEQDGSTIFKINYRYKENPYSDFFYLMLSDTKLQSLGFSDLAANRFLSEPEIKKYLNQPNFANISKIK